jgi:hypothetical protein
MKRRSCIIPIVALVFVVAAGCAKAPQEDINAAQAEMDKAREAQADVWAPTEFQAAQESMNAAQAEIAAQNSKWIKKYDKASELLAKAKEEAGRASEAAAVNKEQTKKDAETALADAEAALTAAEAGLKVAPVTKDSKADLALYKGDLDTLRASLEEARTANSAGDYKKALETATSVKDRGSSIATQLEEAKKKRSAQVRRS